MEPEPRTAADSMAELSDDEEDILWGSSNTAASGGGGGASSSSSSRSRLAERRAVYAAEVQDASDSEDEQEDATAFVRRSNVVSAAELLGPRWAGSGGGSGTAAAASTPAAAARPQAAAPSATAEAEEEEEEEDGSDSDDEDDDGDDDLEDELGGGDEADRRFQAMLEQMQQGGGNASGAAGGSEDLLSQILKGGASSWKTGGAARTRTNGDDDDDDDATGSTRLHGAAVADDQVDYQIYVDDLCGPASSSSSSTSSGGSQDSSSSLVLTRLAALRAAILAAVAPATSEHVWQHQGLQLHICAPHVHSASAASAAATSTPAKPSSSSSAASSGSAFASVHASSHSRSLSHLHGSTYFGDNVGDEWFLVYLLLVLTSDPSFADLSISFSDADGSFLAIEVAEALPEWLSRPEAAVNRVWIRRGALHLIPPPQSPAQLAVLPARPTIEQALQVLRTQPVPTAASSAVQQALLQKLAPFFAAASRPTFSLGPPSLSAPHYARMALPLSLALLLHHHHCDQLLAEWGQAFLARDGIDMQRGNKMERVLGQNTSARRTINAHGDDVERKAGVAATATATASSSSSSSSPSAVPFVFIRVRFTRALYAALAAARWGAPRVFARFHSALTSSQGVSGPLVAQALELGSKVATGAEMWAANRRKEMARARNKARIAREKLPPNHVEVLRRDEAVALARKAREELAAARLHSATDVEALLASVNSDLPALWRPFLAEARSRGVPASLALHFGLPSSSSSIDGDIDVNNASSVEQSRLVWRTLLAHFLAARFQPHQCVDFEQQDELLRDPTLLPLFDPAEMMMMMEPLSSSSTPSPSLQQQHPQSHLLQRRVESCINLAHEASLLDDMDWLCDSCCAASSLTESATTTQTTAAASSSTSLAASLPPDLASVAQSLLSTHWSALARDDSDEWRNMAPEELEAMLAQAAAPPQAQMNEDDDASMASSTSMAQTQQQQQKQQQERGQHLVNAVRHFVEHGKSELASGVEVPNNATAAAARQSTSSKPAKSVSFAAAPVPPAFAPINVDTDALMRLLAGAQADAAQFNAAAATDLGSGHGHGSFNAQLGGGTAAASALQEQLPASDSDDDEEEEKESDRAKPTAAAAGGSRKSFVEAEDDDDAMEDIGPDGRPYPAPTRETTRPPINDAYANVFGDNAAGGDDGASGAAAAASSEPRPGPSGASSVTPDGKLLPWAPEALQKAQQARDEAAAATAVASTSAVPAAAAATPLQTSQPQPQAQPSSQPPQKKKQQQPGLQEYMSAMDVELQQAGLQSDFVRDTDAAAASSSSSTSSAAASSSGPSGGVHVDANLLTNLLRSHEAEQAQVGAASGTGPVTALLASLGVPLPHGTTAQARMEDDAAEDAKR
jgi:hypothetical protein